MNTLTENLEQIGLADYLLQQTDETSPVDGAPDKPIICSTPDYRFTLEYRQELYNDSTGRDLNYPTLTMQYTEENYQKIMEAVSWLIEQTFTLLAETTNNDPLGWFINIQTSDHPTVIVSVTVNDYAS